jgi:hypothetical protein
VGAVANLMIEPYGALLAGAVAGIISTFGYQVIQVLQDRIGHKVFQVIKILRIM